MKSDCMRIKVLVNKNLHPSASVMIMYTAVFSYHPLQTQITIYYLITLLFYFILMSFFFLIETSSPDCAECIPFTTQ